MTLKIHNQFGMSILFTAQMAESSICALAQTVEGTITGIVYGPDGKPLAHEE